MSDFLIGSLSPGAAPAVVTAALFAALAVVYGVHLSRSDAARRRAEHALLESQKRLSVAMTGASVAAWEIDPATRTLLWSDNLSTLVGARNPEPSVGFEGFSQIHPDDRRHVATALEQAIAKDAPLDVEFRVVSSEGGDRWLRSVGRTTSTAGLALQTIFSGVMTDVTGRRLLEAQFRQAQKTETVGQLAGGIAHDFNNLLTAILGYARLLKNDPIDSTQERDIDEIIKAAGRAAALTRQLLAFSRPHIPKTTTLNLNVVVEDLLDMLRRLIGEHIALTTALSDDLALVRADVGQLEQVIVNLVLNARDAMPDGGLVRIDTSNVRLDRTLLANRVEVAPGDYVVLAVSDTGTGMTEETKQRLFEPFFTTKAKSKGTGLGLATVYGIVTQCGGYVLVYSDLGHGTNFKVYLPRATGAREVAPEVPDHGTDPIEAARYSVLVVEDEGAVRTLARIILERAGYRVFDAGTPADAEAVVRTNGAVDILVTDVVMPGGRGTDLYARLAIAHPSMRVLFMSGYTADAAIHQIALKPGVSYMQKPFSAEGLLTKLAQLLNVSGQAGSL